MVASSTGAVSAMEALNYLHCSVAEVVDHSNREEQRRYQALAGWLFVPSPIYSTFLATKTTGTFC